MPLLKNINPLGHVDLPLIGRQGDNGIYAEPDENGFEERTPVIGSGCLEAGEEFEAGEYTKQLLEQAGNYEPADEAAQAIYAELNTPPEPEPVSDPDPLRAVPNRRSRGAESVALRQVEEN